MFETMTVNVEVHQAVPLLNKIAFGHKVELVDVVDHHHVTVRYGQKYELRELVFRVSK